MLLNKHPNDYKADKPRKDVIRKIKEHLNKGKKYNILSGIQRLKK